MIDSHIHLDDKRFDSDRDELLKQARQADITGFVVPAVSVDSCAKVLNLANTHADIFPAFGLHPYFYEQHQQADLQTLTRYIEEHKPVAVGECGLDYYHKDLDKAKQQAIFEPQVELAKSYNLPLILHVNGAVQAVFETLKKYDYYKAVMHSFNGSVEQAEQATEAGVILGFGTAVVNPKAHKLHRVIKAVAVKHIVVETDAPDQSIYDQKQQRNLPICLTRVVDAIADLKSMSSEQMAKLTSENCRQLFAL